jgi:hypothetical protein
MWGARLIEHDSVHAAERLEVHPAFDDRAEPSRPPDTAQDGERCAGGDATCAGDDDDRDRRTHVLCDKKCQCSRPERQIDEVGRETIRETLNRSTGLLRLLDGFDDPPVARVAADPIGADLEHSRGVDRSCIRGGARRLFDWHRLAVATAPSWHHGMA